MLLAEGCGCLRKLFRYKLISLKNSENCAVFDFVQTPYERATISIPVLEISLSDATSSKD
jgi:hypothetical protein